MNMTKPWEKTSGVTGSEIGSTQSSICTCREDFATCQAHPVKPGGEQTAASKAEIFKADRVADLAIRKSEQEDKFLQQLEKLNTLDWEDMPAPVLARLIMSKPFKQGKDEPDYYMSPQQALIYASSVKFLNAGCKRPELKLNPFLNDCWPDTKTMKINVTVEGQRKLAARRNDLGIPTWKQVERPLPEGKAKVFPWMKTDIGMECLIPVGNEKVAAIAWMSNWFKATPIWRENWEHMLRVRSEGLCYETITGVGISQPHEDKEIQNTPPYESPIIQSTEFVNKEMK